MSRNVTSTVNIVRIVIALVITASVTSGVVAASNDQGTTVAGPFGCCRMV